MEADRAPASGDDALLDAAEARLIERAFAVLDRRAPDDARLLRRQLDRLALLGRVHQAAPSIRRPSRLAGRLRDEETLVARLARADDVGSELSMPEKAVVAHAFLGAKISLLRAFSVAFGGDAPGADRGLHEAFRFELAQSIFTAISLDLLRGLMRDPGLAEPVRKKAARALVRFWDRVIHLEIDDFCPMLESAWHARRRLESQLGALLGTWEYLRLVEGDCSEEFLGFFTRDDVSEGERQAFEEFLFNLPFEDITRLRAHMKQAGAAVIDRGAAEAVLGRTIDEVGEDAEALYRSYCRRRTAAEFRRITEAAGPLRVAEGYLMIHVLESQRAG
jgi:hypothetical protein